MAVKALIVLPMLCYIKQGNETEFKLNSVSLPTPYYVLNITLDICSFINAITPSIIPITPGIPVQQNNIYNSALPYCFL